MKTIDVKRKNLIVNIHDLGILHSKINNWYWNNTNLNFEEDNELRFIHTGLMLVTNDKELDDKSIFDMDKESIWHLFVRKHNEYLNKFSEELLSS